MVLQLLLPYISLKVQSCCLLRCVTGAVYLVDEPQCFLCVEVTLARHVWAWLACVMLRDKYGRAAAAGVALTVLRNLVVTVSRVLALLASCRQQPASSENPGTWQTAG